MRRFGPLLLSVIGVVAGILTTFASTPNNGDLAYLESLYHHLFVLGRPWREFVFTEASFLFPDAVLYVPLRAMFGGQVATTAGYVICNLTLTLALFDRLYRRRWPAADHLARAMAIVTTLLLIGLVARANRTVFWPNHHGALLPILLLFTLVTPRTNWGKGALVGVTALTTASDAVALMQVFLPLLGVHLWRRERGGAITVGSGVGLGLALLALIKSQHLMRLHTATLWPTVEQLRYELAHLGGVAWGWLVETWAFHAGLVALLCLGGRRRAVPAVFVVAIGTSFVVSIAMGRLLDAYSIRYVLNYFYLTSFGVVCYLGPRLTEASRARAYAPVAVAVAALVVAGRGLTHGLVFFDRSLTECVLRAIPEGHGLAGFWPAKFITFTGGPTVNQVGPGFTKYLWMNAESWYRPGARFVVTDDQLTGDTARAWFGPPAGVFSCDGGHDVYLYPGGLPEPRSPAGVPD